jgi:hypothetical protein
VAIKNTSTHPYLIRYSNPDEQNSTSSSVQEWEYISQIITFYLLRDSNIQHTHTLGITMVTPKEAK